MERGPNRTWWLFFGLWLCAAAVAIAYPLLRERDMGTFFQLLALSMVAALPGFVLLIVTFMNWRKLRIFQKCLGLLPVLYLFAPFLLMAR